MSARRVPSRQRLEGLTAVVTGAGMGIGEAIARTFAHEGARVVIAEVNEAAGRSVAEAICSSGGEARFLRTDVRNEDDVAATIDFAKANWNRLDILVNNAAIALPDRDKLTSLAPDLWDEIVNVNMRSVFYGMKYAVPEMIEGGGGTIVSIASIGALSGAGGTFAYGTTKAAVIKMTMSAAANYAAHNIRVNAIAPGIILTPLSRRSMSDKSEAEQEAAFARLQPLRRCGRPQDIADAALYLAGPESTFVTGQTLVVDGGLVMAGRAGIMSDIGAAPDE